jgi:hypothetical protein
VAQPDMSDHWNPAWRKTHRTAPQRFHRQNPTLEQIREGLLNQTCPWCGAGPFRRLASHTEKIHAINRWLLRDAALVVKSQRTCDPELSNALRLLALERPSFRLANKKHPGSQSLTRAGYLVKREAGLRNLEKMQAASNRPSSRAKIATFAKTRPRRPNGTFLPKVTA